MKTDFSTSINRLMSKKLSELWDSGCHTRDQLIEAFGGTNPEVEPSQWVDKFMKTKPSETNAYGKEEKKGADIDGQLPQATNEG